MNIKQIKEYLQENPGYLKKGKTYLSDFLDCTEEDIERAKKDIKNSGNVLIIGDLHCPWDLKGYAQFCKEIQIKHECTKVIFIGDVIDGNSWSYHEKDVDGLSVKYEVENAIEHLQEYYKLFPEALICWGNHDLLIERKARTAGMSRKFIKSLHEIIEAPKGWKFVHQVVIDDVRYTHGSVGNAFKVAERSRISTVQGHFHRQASIQWTVSEKDALYGMQVGCGVDHEAYAFDYSRAIPAKPVISCAVVKDGGKLPIIELMKL